MALLEFVRDYPGEPVPERLVKLIVMKDESQLQMSAADVLKPINCIFNVHFCISELSLLIHMQHKKHVMASTPTHPHTHISRQPIYLIPITGMVSTPCSKKGSHTTILQLSGLCPGQPG